MVNIKKTYIFNCIDIKLSPMQRTGIILVIIGVSNFKITKSTRCSLFVEPRRPTWKAQRRAKARRNTTSASPLLVVGYFFVATASKVSDKTCISTLHLMISFVLTKIMQIKIITTLLILIQRLLPIQLKYETLFIFGQYPFVFLD